MRDFTLSAYKRYLLSIKKQEIPFLLFRDFISLESKPTRFCLIRHDVDRKPENALNMAVLEAKLGIFSTYYFRAKPNTFKPKIIKEIENLGHEIGYHYESLSDTDGNIEKAVEDFKENLKKFRAIANIKTCSMHGRPFKKFDNRDIWRIEKNHDFLVNELELLGEVYLDINYSDIAYINDTGRNWTSGKSNVRDKVESKIAVDFINGEELLSYLKNNPHPKICFQIHPERWSNTTLDYMEQLSRDKLINFIKSIIR